MTLYVYELETMEIVVEIEGADNAECERLFVEAGYVMDEYGGAYSKTDLIEVAADNSTDPDAMDKVHADIEDEMMDKIRQGVVQLEL